MKNYLKRTSPLCRLITVALCLLFTQPIAMAASRTVRSLLEIRQQQVVIQQFDLSCGAAALATLLRYQFGDTVTEHDIATTMVRRNDYMSDPDLLRQQQGFSLLDLKRYVQHRGYDGLGYSGMTLEDLMQQAPVMVPINLHGYQHFVIFRGAVNERVVLADPAWGNRSMSIEAFMRAWLPSDQVGGIGFIVMRRDQDLHKNRLAPRADDFVLFN